MTEDEHYDHFQIEIPESFMALYVTAGRLKPNTTRSDIAARYELCDDLANQLHDYALARHHDLGISEHEVLTRCHEGLSDVGAGISPPEAIWVIRRLAELLDWRSPSFEGEGVRDPA